MTRPDRLTLDTAVRLGTLAGIPVAMRVSFLFGAAFLAAPLWLRGTWATTILGCALIGCLVGSIVVHELAHAGAARAFGIACRGIELHALGGFAVLDRMPRGTGGRVAILLAGPLANLALYGFFATLAEGSPAVAASRAVALARDVNFGLFAFNLLPCLPLDGGRALHALLVRWVARRHADRAVGVLGLAVAGYCVLAAIPYPTLLFVAVYLGLASLAVLRAGWVD